MECPKCKARIGIMKHLLMVETGAVHCIKCYICGYWVQIDHGKIAHYQCIVPSTWNSGPRDKDGVPGPYEASLVGTPVADADQPLEVLRTLHSFDPCMACAVHVVDPKGRELSRVKVR